jgi:O-6-methylguanine DNA methyltransferase
MHTASIETDDGVFTAHFSTKGLASLRFPSHPAASSQSPFASPLRRGRGIKGEGGAPPSPPLEERAGERRDLSKWIELTSKAVRAVLAGNSAEELPPFDLSEGTDFQLRVWQAMSGIPIGRTLSYGELAEQIGAPKAVRAVGRACGANPIPLLIPCHRVLAANGRLGGFSGGLSWKMLLLKREMIACLLPAANASKPFSQRSLPGL